MSHPYIGTASIATLLMAATALGHHSFAMFDRTRTETVKGTVRAFEWSNPHCWLWVDVLDKQGRVEAWGFETAGPSQLRPYGIGPETFRPGDKLTVQTHPLKDGRKGGELAEATLADGKVINVVKNLQKSGLLPSASGDKTEEK